MGCAAALLFLHAHWKGTGNMHDGGDGVVSFVVRRSGLNLVSRARRLALLLVSVRSAWRWYFIGGRGECVWHMMIERGVSVAFPFGPETNIDETFVFVLIPLKCVASSQRYAALSVGFACTSRMRLQRPSAPPALSLPE